MALRDLSKFLEDDGLDYPLPSSAFTDPARFPDGKTYKVPSPDARTGLWLAATADLGVAAANNADISEADVERLKLDDDQEQDLYRRVLGPVHGQMLADGVKWTALKQVALDAYFVFAMDTDVADAVLAGAGEAQARGNRASRRAAKKTAGRRSRPASGAATKTPPPADTGSSTSPTAPEQSAATG